MRVPRKHLVRRVVTLPDRIERISTRSHEDAHGYWVEVLKRDAAIAQRKPPGRRRRADAPQRVDATTACGGAHESSCAQLVSGVGEQDSSCAQLVSELQVIARIG
jgi:hypothetical protein